MSWNWVTIFHSHFTELKWIFSYECFHFKIHQKKVSDEVKWAAHFTSANSLLLFTFSNYLLLLCIQCDSPHFFFFGEWSSFEQILQIDQPQCLRDIVPKTLDLSTDCKEILPYGVDPSRVERLKKNVYKKLKSYFWFIWTYEVITLQK